MKISVLKPIAFGLLASAVITACGGSSSKSGNNQNSGAKAVCDYNIQGGNAISIALGTAYTNPAVRVKKEGEDVAFKMEGTVDSTKLGSYDVTYSSDSCKNTQVRTVTVIPAKSCIYKLSGDNPLNIRVGETFSDPGFVVTDAKNNVIKGTATGDVDTSKEAEYTRTYQGEGCKNTVTRTVKVKVVATKDCAYSFADNTNPLTLFKGDTYVDVKPTVKNAMGEEIASNAITVKSNNVDTKTVKNNYKVVYESEECSNTATRQVNVELPNCVYQFPNDKQTMDLIAGHNYVAPTVSIKDMTDVTASVLSGEVNKNTPATYTVVYGAEGVCANTANFIVNVKKITDEELKKLKEDIGKIILPKI